MKVYIGKGSKSCDLNYEHDYIFRILSEHFEMTENIPEADIIIIAETCCCVESAINETMQRITSILEMKKASAKTYLTGCITKKFHNIPSLLEIEKWLKENIDFIVPLEKPNLLLKLISEKDFKMLDANEFGCIRWSKTSANIFISTGCQNNCGFCKVTYQNQPLRSCDIIKLEECIDLLNKKNISEINLLGTNVCQYGLDTHHEPMLPEIINYLEIKNNIKKVNLIGFAFKDAIKFGFQNILNNSTKVTTLTGGLESGSDRLLKLIRKGFTSEEIIEFVEFIRQKKHKDLDLDIISGLPTETLEDVQKTLEVLKQLQPSGIGITEYMDSSFVYTHQFPQLSHKKTRKHTNLYVRTLQKQGVNIYKNYS